MNAIMQAQGYASPLEQYTMKSKIDLSAEGNVMIATHNALGVQVVIKAIPS